MTNFSKEFYNQPGDVTIMTRSRKSRVGGGERDSGLGVVSVNLVNINNFNNDTKSQSMYNIYRKYQLT